jgi:hypothetical protein
MYKLKKPASLIELVNQKNRTRNYGRPLPCIFKFAKTKRQGVCSSQAQEAEISTYHLAGKLSGKYALVFRLSWHLADILIF